MKIVCDSCGAKYSIADEKVAGKVFKIRCKKCSSVIVVKGDQEEGDESTRVFDYGAEAIWHVVIDGDQQGPFAPRQIADLLAENKIDWEAYVWREGMDGWQPAKDVEVLVSAVMAEAEGGGGAAPAAGKPAAASAYGTGQVFGGSSDMGADPFAASADDGGLSGVMGKSAAAGAGGADLFARSDRSPFSGAADDDGMSHGQMNGHSKGSSPRVTEDQSLTGQRNENSVLFSLSNLQALATGSGSAPASTRPKAGMATGEGSGLIDIRALASATQAVGESRTNGASKDSVEDLLAVGGGTAFSAASLAAPVAGEKPESNNTKLLIGGFAAVIVLLIGVVVVLATKQPEAAPIAAAPVAAPAPAAPAAAAQAAVAAPSAEAPSAAAPSEEGAKDEDSNEEKSARSDKSDKGRKKAGGASEAPKAAEKAPEPEPAKPAKPSGDRSLDDLLDSALGGKPAKPAAAAPKPAAAPAADLPAMPAKDDVLSAMKGVQPRVQSCGNGQSGVAMAKITVAGATGRVTNVDVSGQFAGTPVAACVTKEVSKAKFPKFSQSSFSIAYPFKI